MKRQNARRPVEGCAPSRPSCSPWLRACRPASPHKRRPEQADRTRLGPICPRRRRPFPPSRSRLTGPRAIFPSPTPAFLPTPSANTCPQPSPKRVSLIPCGSTTWSRTAKSTSASPMPSRWLLKTTTTLPLRAMTLALRIPIFCAPKPGRRRWARPPALSPIRWADPARL